LDYLRGSKGENELYCGLTLHVFGPGERLGAPCLSRCGYPAQARRGLCKHMNTKLIITSKDGLALPRISCAAHGNFDAPAFCGQCPDYAVREPKKKKTQ
jgi:hypothetical protein